VKDTVKHLREGRQKAAGEIYSPPKLPPSGDGCARRLGLWRWRFLFAHDELSLARGRGEGNGVARRSAFPSST
jgi:hypothetical protein